MATQSIVSSKKFKRMKFFDGESAAGFVVWQSIKLLVWISNLETVCQNVRWTRRGFFDAKFFPQNLLSGVRWAKLYLKMRIAVQTILIGNILAVKFIEIWPDQTSCLIIVDANFSFCLHVCFAWRSDSVDLVVSFFLLWEQTNGASGEMRTLWKKAWWSAIDEIGMILPKSVMRTHGRLKTLRYLAEKCS